MNSYPEKQFSIIRILFGLHIFFHLVTLLPHAQEVFGATGVLPDHTATHWIIFPSLFTLFNMDAYLEVVMGFGAILALMFTFGIYRKPAAILLWYILASLIARNFFAANISKDYMGWLLIATVLVPQESVWSVCKGKKPWVMPRLLFEGAWIITGISYTLSAFNKLDQTSVWVDGTAMRHYLEFPMAAHNWLTEALLSGPNVILVAMTYWAFCTEFFSLPFSLFERTRPIIWTMLFAMHVMIAFTSILAQLSIYVMIFNFFIFDYRWVQGKSLDPAIWWPKLKRSLFANEKEGLPAT